MPETVRPVAGTRPILSFALTVALYVLAGLAGFALAIRPDQASPLYPAAGVALAAILIEGRRALLAIAVGALLVHLLRIALGAPVPPSAVDAAVLSGAVVVGAVLQAALGAALIERFVAQPLTLAESRDVLRFVAVAVGSCLVNSLIGNAAIYEDGLMPETSLWLNIASWWIGDLIGVLIVLPVALSLFGQPREAWRPRRMSVGITLSLVTLVLAGGIRAVGRWHEERRMGAFERDAQSASMLLKAQLVESLQALKALRGILIASDGIHEADIAGAMHDWLGPGQLVGVGWAEWMQRDLVTSFESRAHTAGSLGYRVFDAPASVPDPRADVFAIRFIEPMSPANLQLIGLNEMSIAASRAALERSRASAEAVATAGFVWPESGANGTGPVNVGVFQVLFGPQRGAAPLGAAFVTLRPEDQVRAVQAGIPAYLQLCIVDVSPGEPPQQRPERHRLAGPAACETAATGPSRSTQMVYAGRHWELRAFAAAAALPDGRDADVWLFAIVGLLSTAMLGGFLLVTTGRARRIEIAVRERTAALEAEVRERERAETALRESEQRFRNILNNVPMGICYTDLLGNVKQSNPRFRDMVGYGEEELLSLTAADFTHPDDRALDLQLSSQLIRGEVPMYRRHKRYVTANGTVLQVQTTVTLLRDAFGAPRRLVGVIEDVTEHMKLEEAERAREAAEASNRAKSEFLSRMSHELRTPLNAMLGFAQLLELDPRNPLNAVQRPWVVQIQQAGWHLLEMINDVLDLSRIESGNLRLSAETLPLDALIESTRAMVQGEADRRGITITHDRRSHPPSALGDATRVKQILTNLLTNAVKYNADGGSVEIATRQVTEQAVEISVTDSGLGMTETQLQQLFEPFNRLGREKSSLQGTGIGLVISQRLAELMGGSLTARSVAGVGSTFTLTLPSEVDPDTVRSEFDLLTQEPADYQRRLVHYVEDNETNVEVMRGILAQRPQVELEVSVTGLDGLAAIRARQPDLILLDMHLPDISGMELLRHFKADPDLAAIPVVVVSADALPEQVGAAFEAGCSNYLTKPVNIAELLRIVDTLLEEIDTRYG